MIRWFIRADGVKVLQYWYSGHIEEWRDAPEITADQEKYREVLLQKQKEIDNERIAKQLKGKRYTVR